MWRFTQPDLFFKEQMALQSCEAHQHFARGSEGKTTSIILRFIPSVHFNPSVEILVLSSVRKIKATQSQYYDLVKRQLQAGQTQCKQIILNS